ncbi:MAG: TonB-dependent receptor plug domain-containing protein [Flavobacteriaceae bacterium]
MQKMILSGLLGLQMMLGYAVETRQVTSVLNEVILQSSRIEIPFSDDARNISIVSKEDIQQSGAQSLAELLQNVAGIDIRRRGIQGMQADLYIRGGSFDQTLLLIDGVRVDDPQTGHHTLNLALPLEVLERIEILKGPAARIYGANAFTGAINLVTKNPESTIQEVETEYGAFEQQHYRVLLANGTPDSGWITQYSHRRSDGYRYNTDFTNHNLFLKGNGQFNQKPVQLIASFQSRQFGANGFYASPAAIDQYEETQGSLVALTSRWQSSDWVFKPRLYWRRNQDMYEYIRNRPDIYRNLHISNKLGFALDTYTVSDWGKTGLGIDVNRVTIASNNLGNRKRNTLTTYIEHRFEFYSRRLSITPGAALNYFSDFGTHLFPGIDIGLRLNRFQIFSSVGYTYRIPTYTDLYYADRTTIGNADLAPEEALNGEIGFNWDGKNIQIGGAIFIRSSENLIDYTKTTADALWEANNIQDLRTSGLELDAQTDFAFGSINNKLDVAYTYLNDELKAAEVPFSRYSINSLKHHFTANWTSFWTSKFQTQINYRFAQRESALVDPYHLVDGNVRWQLGQWTLSAGFYNIFNTEYTETNLVPMPLGHAVGGLSYRF